MEDNYMKTFNILEHISSIIGIYNNRPHASINFLSPNDYISLAPNSDIRLKPAFENLNLKNEKSIGNDGTFLYDVNKLIIDKMMLKAEQNFLILSCVLISAKRKEFLKSARSEKWAFEHFFVHKLKRPYLSSEQVTYTLIDLRGRPLLGNFYASELKRVNFKNYSNYKISGFTEIFIDKKSNRTKYIITLLTFPKTILFVVNKSDLIKLQFTQDAMRQFNNFENSSQSFSDNNGCYKGIL